MNSEFKKSLKKLFKKVTKGPLVISLISSLIYYYSRFIGKTTRWKMTGVKEFYQTWDKEKSLILTGWHGRALMFPFFWNKERPLNALVSLHQDGRLIAGVLEKYGFGTVGGSSNDNARGAAMELMRSLQKGESIGIIPDGPRGPRMKMTLSPLFYARKTGKPLFGITYGIKNNLIIKKAWDQMMIPLPFSKGIVRVTEPFYVPADASDEELETFRQKFEDLLNNACYETDRQLGIEPTRPDPAGGVKVKRDHSWKGVA